MTGSPDRDRECGVCGGALGDSPLFRARVAGAAYDILPCARCGAAATSPRPSPEDLARFYGSRAYRADDGARFNAAAEAAVGWARDARVRRIGRLAPGPGRLLDVGCGRGFFLRRMRRAGWSVAGIEADAGVARKLSGTHGIDVRGGDPEGWGYADGSFDVVTLYHVLEHLARPADMIGRCRRLLKDGGLLVVAVPNRDSLQAAFGRGSWFHLDPPFHLHHFTASGLAALLGRSGFRVVGERHFDLEQNVFGWAQTLLNRCGLPRNALFDFLKAPALRAGPAAGTAWSVAASLVLLAPVLPAATLLAVLEATAGRGGTVEIAAVKEGAWG